MNVRKKRGATLVETVAGIIVLLPVFFLLIDVASLLICETQNEALAKNAARAAADRTNFFAAQQAAQGVLDGFGKSNLVANPTIASGEGGNFVYDTVNGKVLVVTKVTCYLPVPMPFFGNHVDFVAEATEPIVALPPD